MLLTHPDADDFSHHYWKFGERPEWWGDWKVMWEFTDQASGKTFVTNSLDRAVVALDEEFTFRPPTLLPVKLRGVKPKDRAAYRHEWRTLNDHRIREAAQRELYAHCPREHVPHEDFELPVAKVTVRTHDIYEYLRNFHADVERLRRIASDDLRWLKGMTLATIEQALATNPFVHHTLFREDLPNQCIGIPPQVLRGWAREHDVPQVVDLVKATGHLAPTRFKTVTHRLHGVEVDAWARHKPDASARLTPRPPFEAYDWRAGHRPDWWASQDRIWEFEFEYRGETRLLAVNDLDEAVLAIQRGLGEPGPSRVQRQVYQHTPLPGDGRPGQAFALSELSASVRTAFALPYLGVRYQRHRALQALVNGRMEWFQSAVGLVAKRHAATYATDPITQASIFTAGTRYFLPVTADEAVRWSTGAPLELIQLRDAMAHDQAALPTAEATQPSARPTDAEEFL